MALTKSDLKAIQLIVDNKKTSLSQEDFNNIEELIKTNIRLILNLEEGQTFDEKLSYLPTKEEFFTKEDEVLKELKTVREEMQVLNGLHQKVNNQETRTEKLEEIHPNNKHSLVI